MNTNAIVKSDETTFLSPVISVQEVLQAYQAKKELIDGIMKSNVDYGIIPGTTKPCLLKAGAEKLTSFFGLSTKFFDVSITEDFTGKEHDGEPLFFYRRACELWRGDRFIARAEGSCNSWEKKYRYRSAERVCPECGKPTIKKSKFPPREDPDAQPGFYCYGKIGGCDAQFAANDPAITAQELGQVKNPDTAEIANTVLKMADKRALVAVTLIATGMSEYFTQDMEDYIMEGHIEAVVDPEPKKNAEPKKKVDPKEVISDGQWAQFMTLVDEIDKASIPHPVYTQTEMTLSQMQGATKWAEGKLKPADKK